MQPDPMPLEQAEKLRTEILSVPGVADLYGGRFGEVAMLYPGARVRGLRLATNRALPDAPRMEVHLVADLSQLPNLDALAETVRQITERYVSYPVDVFVSDAA